MPVTLLDLPTDELTAMARGVRDAATGTRVTYSPKVFVPADAVVSGSVWVLHVRDGAAPHRSPFLSPEEVLAVASARCRGGLSRGAVHPGRGPGGPVRRGGATGWPTTGTPRRSTTWSRCGRRVLDETGLLPHANAGAVSREDLARLRTVAPSQGMMIESLRPDLAAHRGAPGQDPRAPAGHPGVRPGSWASRSPRGSWSASVRPRPTGWPRWRRSPPATAGTATCRR